jgi:hypothetical protein
VIREYYKMNKENNLQFANATDNSRKLPKSGQKCKIASTALITHGDKCFKIYILSMLFLRGLIFIV